MFSSLHSSVSYQDSGGTAARALSTLRLRAVTGARSAEGLEPVDTELSKGRGTSDCRVM